MQVNPINNTSFNGGFRVPCASDAVRTAVKNLNSMEYRVIYGAKDARDVMVITNHTHDKMLSELFWNISKGEVKYLFYPQFTLKNNNDTDDSIRNSIRYERLTALRNATFSLNEIEGKSKVYKKAELILEKEGLNPANVTEMTHFGASIFYDNSAGKRVIISPVDEYGFGYMKVLSDKSNGSGRFYLVKETDKDYKVLRQFSGVDEITEFKKDFDSSLYIYDTSIFRSNFRAQSNFESLLRDMKPEEKDAFVRHATEEVDFITYELCSAQAFYPSKTLASLINFANKDNENDILLHCTDRYFYTKYLRKEINGVWKEKEMLKDLQNAILSK